MKPANLALLANQNALSFLTSPGGVLATLMAVAAALSSGACQAAGGHFAVEDAFVAEPAHCDSETWHEFDNGHDSSHTGLGCHWRGLEPGLNLDLGRLRGEPRNLAIAPQIKAVHAFNDQWSLGGVWLTGFGQSAPGRAWEWQGHLLLVPVTWSIREDLQLHVNLGRNFNRAAPDTTRRGAALEWHPAAQWTAIGEYFHDGETPFHRVGTRWQLLACCSVDLSRAQPHHGLGGGWWTLGWNWTFGE